ncbi:hypothetical protein SUGI_0039080 [Cryptomeria japonica]|nr:hypothetical protein SUGI_0039080 [Cryptomeria japonica]
MYQIEKPCYQLLWTAQIIIPDNEGAIKGHLKEVGLTFHLRQDVPGLISNNIEKDPAVQHLRLERTLLDCTPGWVGNSRSSGGQTPIGS